MIDTGGTRNGWNARVTRLGADSLLAVLNVPSATSDFAGKYTCGPPSLQLASATLHVLHGNAITTQISNLSSILHLEMTNGGSPRHERSIDPSEVQFDKKSMPSNSDIECRRKRNRLSLKQLEFSGISELE